MAAIRERKTKEGQRFYEIRCRVSRDRPELSRRWYPPEGWSAKAIQKELAKIAAEFERQAQAGEIISRSEKKEKKRQAERAAAAILTVRKYGETVFMPEKAIRCSESTREYYQTQLNLHVYPEIGDLRLTEVSPAHLNALLLSMQAGKYAHSSLIAVYTTLHQLFKSAYMCDLIEKNPMDKTQRPRKTKERLKADRIEAYSAEELCYILQCIDSAPLKWRAMIHLLVDSGLRRGEACGLQWRYVDFENGRITIAASLNYTPSKGVYLGTPKSGKLRTIDVAPEVMALLKELRNEQASKALSQFVFTQENTPEPMHPQSPTRYLMRLGKRYGIPDLHPHKLRHSFASVAITNGADIASVSEKLGHADKAITLKMYTHADAASIKRAGDIFREALKEKKA